MPREKFKTLTEQMFYILLCLRRECRGVDILETVRATTAGRVTIGSGTLTGLYSPGMITAAALGLFFLLYGIYILMAYTSLKRTVLPEP